MPPPFQQLFGLLCLTKISEFMCKLIVVVYEISYLLESNLRLSQIAYLSLLTHHIFQLFQRSSLKKSYFKKNIPDNFWDTK